MKTIEEYIVLTKNERQQHINLTELCTERGGPQNGGLSSYCKGLMAHILDTTIPSGHKIHVCHACNNAKCSNPNHLYWGTAQENRVDQGKTLSAWERTIEKYGEAEARRLASSCKINNQHASGNKGRSLTEEHKAKIAANHKGGRKKKE